MPYTALRTRPAKPENERRRRVLKIAQVAAFVLGPVVLLSLIAAAVVYVRLIHGPVSLKSFSERIEASINAELDGFAADIDDAVLTLADDYTVELRLINLRLNDAQGDLIASAPMAAVELDKAALWRLEANPERVYLIEPRLTVTYSDAQGFSLSISDGPAGEEKPIIPPRPVPARPPASASGGGAADAPSFHRIDVARILAETSARARRGKSGSSRLREFGVRNAIVSISYNGQMSQISVPEASVDLAHSKRRSIVSGSATVASEKGPWSVEVRMDESDRRDTLQFTATVRDFVPSTLSKISSGLGLLAMLDTPMTGDLALTVSDGGDLRTADLTVDLGHGFVRLPSMSGAPMLLDSGRVVLAYDADARRLTLSPSTFDWGDSRATLEGAVTSDPAQGGAPQWHFGVRSVEGVLAADEFGVAPIPIESFQATGRIIPSEGLVQLAGLSLKVGGGEVTANGELINGPGPSSTRIEGWLSPMPLATLKALWPRAAAPAARTWVGTEVEKATVKSASLKLLSGRFLETEGGSDTASPDGNLNRLSAIMEVADLRMHPLPQSLPIDAPQATIRLENSTLEVIVPKADIIASETGKLPVKEARFTVVDVTHDAPVSELALKSQAPLSALIDTLNHSQLHLAGQGPLPIDGIDGKVDGEIKISMPLVTGASVVKAEGKARITDLKGKSKAHNIDLQGGTIDINVSDIGVIAKGDLIINGVVTKLQMHRILDALPEMQPPIRISATLDNSDRTQLGLDVNHLVQGDVPVEVTIASKTDAPPTVHVRADLTNAELMFADIAWRKAPGRIASLECDVDVSDPSKTQLRNFRVVGDTIALDGWMTMDEKREVSEFSFPNFSVNVVSRLQVSGKINAQRVWKIAVKGSTFDAKDLFRSLLALGNTTETKIKPLHPAAGVDLTAEIDTVLGHSDVSLRGYKTKVSERGDKLIAIDAQGTLEGGKTLSVQLKPDGPRTLTAASDDAGQAFKLIGFYPNLQGGRLKLEVDLEGKGAAEKSGVLWVDNFRVLGDPIISEVYSSVGTSSSDDAQGGRQRKVQREVFEFQRLTAPFSVGHGQFVLDDTYVRGPLLGASIRGKVDYNRRYISLGGTYVPLQGINSAFCEIPLVGPIVSGFDCQGVFGITYAIQGPMSQPQVLVNPLSMFTPGILRAIMEMTNPNPQVQAPRAPAEKRVRASSTSREDNAPIGTIDGWSSETTQAGDKKRSKK